MGSLFDDIRRAFHQRNNALAQLILVNVLIFLALLIVQVGFALFQNSGIYGEILGYLSLKATPTHLLYRPWTLVSYAFLHKDIWHILFNMLFLYWFGQLVQEYLGSQRLVNVYLLGGIFGGLIFFLSYLFVPALSLSSEKSIIGASGAVYAVMTAAATLLPEYSFHVLFLGLVRIKWIVLFWLVVSFAQISINNAGGNISHLSGALIGYLYVVLLRKGTDLGQPFDIIFDFFKGFFSNKQKPRFNPKSKSAVQAKLFKGAVNKGEAVLPDEDEVDTILDKISKSGYESLTKEEKQRLYKASQK